jgi:hypothetical protein
LYTPSQLRWNAPPDGRVLIEQMTDYPESGDVRIAVKPDRPREFAVNLRIPQWADDTTRILVNGQPIAVAAKPGQFAVVRRNWQDGDSIELKLPLTERAEPIDPQHPDVVAKMRGPLMLVRTGDDRWMPFYKIADERYTTYVTAG